MGIVAALAIVVAVVLALALLARRREHAARARFFRRSGFGAMVLFAAFFALFLVGDTVSDPGGWTGAGLVALWAVPLALICLLAWFRPDPARWVFASLLGVTIGSSIWFAFDPGGWRSFENQHGPVRAVLIFALAAALALWGLRRTMWAGVMLLTLGILPIAISSFGLGHGGMTSLAAASATPVITGLLYLASAREDSLSRPGRA